MIEKLIELREIFKKKEDVFLSSTISDYTSRLAKQDDDTDSLQDSEIKRAIKLHILDQIHNTIFDYKLSLESLQSKQEEVEKEEIDISTLLPSEWWPQSERY